MNGVLSASQLSQICVVFISENMIKCATVSRQNLEKFKALEFFSTVNHSGTTFNHCGLNSVSQAEWIKTIVLEERYTFQLP